MPEEIKHWRWTKKKPAEDGWYWRRIEIDDPRFDVMIRIRDDIFGLHIDVCAGRLSIPDGGLWAGPIVKPLPRKLKKKKRKK